MKFKNPLLRSLVLAGLVCTGISAQAGWQQTFNDEFTATTLDTSKWITTLNQWGSASLPGNGELECYVPENVKFNGNNVILLAEKRNVNCTNPAQVFNYASGAITTSGKYSQLYGYFEMSARIPKGKGLWPAFWLLPAGGAWPPEIDVMEVLNHDTTTLYTTLHWQDPTAGHLSAGGASKVTDLSVGFHRYGVDWQPGLIVWYLDGVEVYRAASTFVPSEPMYMLANLAVGGYWPGNPDSTTVFPAPMEIDYIRAYKRVNDGVVDIIPPGCSAPTSLHSVPARDYTAKFTTKVQGQSALSGNAWSMNLGSSYIEHTYDFPSAGNYRFT
ncbi:MAG: glycoside hydrolase family 16 protein, partial [Bdellovibrionota bacterium]